MEKPEGDQHSAGRSGAEDHNAESETGPTLPGSGADSSCKKNTANQQARNIECGNKKSRCEIVWEIFKFVAELALGASLLTVSFCQYRVYSQQANIMTTQTGIMKDQASMAGRQLDEMKIQSEAMERQATAGRAYLYLDYPVPSVPQITGSASPSRVSIAFRLKNLGQSAAIITDIKSNWFIHRRGVQIPDEPTNNQEAGAFSRNYVSMISIDGNIFTPSDAVPNTIPERHFIESDFNKAHELKIDFGVSDEYIKKLSKDQSISGSILELDNRDSRANFITRNFVFSMYVLVKYLDIFGVSRETCYYGSLYGAGDQLQGKTCNYWK